jgi:hypothetical protein
MTIPHKHAEILRAIADGHDYEYFNGNEWIETKAVTPLTHVHLDFRVKPKPPIVEERFMVIRDTKIQGARFIELMLDVPNIRFTFDPDTKLPIKVELI